MSVIAPGAPDAGRVKRVGFLTGQVSVPDDFDQMDAGELEKLFEGDLCSCCWDSKDGQRVAVSDLSGEGFKSADLDKLERRSDRLNQRSAD